MVKRSRRDDLYNTKTQMKLFNAIAAAAVIGTSFVTASPTEARNWWVKVGTGSDHGKTLYIRPIGCRDSICTAQAKWNDSAAMLTREINCVTWYARTSGRDWRPIMPGSIADGEAEILCR